MNELIEILEINNEIKALVFVGIILYGIFLLRLYWVIVDLIESCIDAVRSIKMRKHKNDNNKETIM